MPLITVIIPMRNAAAYVRAAVGSVLKQTGAELEVIVVDDGSTDASAKIVRDIADPRIRIIPGPQKGISAAFNAGLADAKGEYVARCDADDLYPPARLAWQLEFLQSHSDFGAVSGSFATMTHRGKPVAQQDAGRTTAEEVTAELRAGRGRSHVCAYLFRSSLLRQIGGCREFFVTAEDVDLQLRLAEIARIFHDPRSAYLYRLHDASITHVQKSGERSFFERCAREFQQQRLTRGQDDLQLGHPPAIPKAEDAPRASSRQQIQRLLIGQAWAVHGQGRKLAGIALGLRAWFTSPLHLTVLKSVVALAVKPAR
jgi:glycosyltransferase involved in cell wall biosynthesis